VSRRFIGLFRQEQRCRTVRRMIGLGVRHRVQSREAQMTRTILSVAAALFGATTFLTSAAEACISCEYVPEVVRAGERSHKARTYKTKRVYVADKPQMARPAPKRVAKAETARKAEAPKKAEVAEAAPAETPSKTEKPMSTAALLDVGPAPKAEEKPEVVADVGCKRFFATIGQTLTVPCE
jgi:hypothetical protein